MHKADSASERITWIASYPKSGNTWVRSLLQAYRCDGFLDINDLNIGIGDSAEAFTRAVCPIPLSDLGVAGQYQLRPAALLNALMAKPVPRLFKTHFANLKPPGFPAFIPREFTERAIYIVRDPRDVLTSFCKYFGKSLEKGAEAMGHMDFKIGGDGQTYQLLSSWSNHVSSWGGEEAFPVHVVKYEDLVASPESELTEMLTFLGWDVDEDRVKRAVEACVLSRLQEQESALGFSENAKADERGAFFNGGGSRWREELGPKWADRIAEDHGEVMRLFGYLPSNVTEISSGDKSDGLCGFEGTA